MNSSCLKTNWELRLEHLRNLQHCSCRKALSFGIFSRIGDTPKPKSEDPPFLQINSWIELKLCSLGLLPNTFSRVEQSFSASSLILSSKSSLRSNSFWDVYLAKDLWFYFSFSIFLFKSDIYLCCSSKLVSIFEYPTLNVLLAVSYTHLTLPTIYSV